MMGTSRGIDSSPQATISTVLEQLLALMKDCEPRLRTLIDELKQQEVRNAASVTALQTATSTHDAREAEVLKQEKALETAQHDFEAAQSAIKDREAHSAALDVDVTKREAALGEQQAALTARAAALDARERDIEKDQVARTAELRAAREKAFAEVTAAKAALDKRAQELAIAATSMRNEKAALTEEQSQLATDQTAAGALRDEYTAKLAALRQLAA